MKTAERTNSAQKTNELGTTEFSGIIKLYEMSLNHKTCTCIWAVET